MVRERLKARADDAVARDVFGKRQGGDVRFASDGKGRHVPFDMRKHVVVFDFLSERKAVEARILQKARRVLNAGAAARINRRIDS